MHAMGRTKATPSASKAATADEDIKSAKGAKRGSRGALEPAAAPDSSSANGGSEDEGVCDLCAQRVDPAQDNCARLNCFVCGEATYHQVHQSLAPRSPHSCVARGSLKNVPLASCANLVLRIASTCP